MTVFYYTPPNPDHAYLIVSKNSSPLGFQNLSSNIVYVFSIDTKSGFIYSSSIQNADVFNSIDEAKTFLSQNCKDTEMNLKELGNFLIGSSITESQSLIISVIKKYEKVASIFNHEIYQIIEVNTVNLDFQNKKEPFSQKTVILSKYNYYFSPTLDLSMPFPYYYINQLKLNNNSFCFNRSFLSKFIENQLLIACVIVIKGYIFSEADLIYVAKFFKSKEGTPNLNSESEKLECECELIFRKESSTEDKQQVNYYSHAWRRGPSLYLSNENQNKLLETKNYVTKEILTRFNIEKVHIFSYNDPLEKSNDELSSYFGLKELVIKELNETNIIQDKSDETSSKILDVLSIPGENPNYSLFTVLNQDNEVICIQDFIFRFSSSDCLQMTDIITSAFLSKLANLIPGVFLKTNQTKFLNESIQKASVLLHDHAFTKSSRSFFSKSRLSNNDDNNYFSQNSDPNRIENKKLILDPQHMSYSIKKYGNVHKILYIFPEPFIVCDLYFLVVPQIEDQNKKHFIVHFQYQKSRMEQLMIPIVYKETWLHYDIRYFVKKSLRYDYDPVYFTPISSFCIVLKAPDLNDDSFIIKDIKIGVKRKIKNPFRFIITPPAKTNNKNKKEFQFNDKERSIQDLIDINNNYRVDNCINNFSKNRAFTENNSKNRLLPQNPWFYDLKCQLLSMEKNNCCPLCGNGFKKKFYIAEIIQNFDPILFIVHESDYDNNNKNDCIKICQKCGEITGGLGQESAEAESILTHYKNHKDNFILVDNSNSISYSMKKWENSLHFNSNSNDSINLSRFHQFFGEDLNIKFINKKDIPSHDLQFFTLVNIESVRIELNNNSDSLDDLIIKVQFNQQDINDIELTRQNSTLVFENKFKPIDDISLITLQFISQFRGSINIKKIDVFGTVSNKSFVHPRYENHKLTPFEINPTLNKNYIKSSFDNKTRIQHFDVSLKILKGFSLKSPDSVCHSKSLCFIAILQNNRIVEYDYILPQFPKNDIFSFIFDQPVERVKEVYIVFLDCVPKIEPFAVFFIDK